MSEAEVYSTCTRINNTKIILTLLIVLRVACVLAPLRMCAELVLAVAKNQ